ncbi:hemolysin-III related-domain-containing protein [Mycena sp. CBHHK59/15]|nr:hemolysin-III related-domain-containing protein [Mycena sp. CBHHK59/15]
MSATGTRKLPPSIAQALESLHFVVLSSLAACGRRLSLQLQRTRSLLPSLPRNATLSDFKSTEKALDIPAPDVACALSYSYDGDHLITYDDLPAPWRNNPFISGGYRFIPLGRYPMLFASIFHLHNESLNIHTHLLPLLLWAVTFRATDTAEIVFSACTLACLASSVVWHTMAGCAHRDAMKFCARVDYVGIGWLISASVATIVHYGYACRPHLGYPFLALCLCTALTGSVLPFMAWFDKHENRLFRLAFFLVLVSSAIAPIAGIVVLHSMREMLDFIVPILPTLLSCAIGIVFYAAHIPERFLSDKWGRWLDHVGAGSHAIWHAFIVLGISQWREGLATMRARAMCAAA